VREELDIPLPSMAPSYRAGRQRMAMDPATRRLATFAGVIGGTLLVLVSVWAVSGHHQGGVPVVEADSHPVRVKPQNPGGMPVGGEDDAILSGVSGGKSSLAPAPEVPEPQALKAQEQAAAPPPPARPAAAAPAPPAAAPPAQKVSLTPVEAAPPARQRAQAAMPLPPKPAEAAARHATVSARAAAPVAATTPAGAGAQVQFAALPTEAAALSEWHRLAKRMPDLLGSRRPLVQKSERDGKTFYRLRTGGFADVAQATVFCEQVRSKGGGCAIAGF
jgi:hypothetical protein